MKVLAVDQSLTSTAWCLFDNAVLIKAGLIHSDPEQDDYERTQYIAKELIKFAPFVDVFVFEDLAFSANGSATRKLAGLLFVCHALLNGAGKDCVDIGSGTVKKFATGSGRAKKPQMYEALPAKTKEYFTDKLEAKKTKGLYDLTDAYFVGKCYYEFNK